MFLSKNGLRTIGAIVALFVCFSTFSCKKEANGVDAPDDTSEVPGDFSMKLEAIQGNNQIGFVDQELPQPIVLKLTPKNAVDLKKYNIRLRSQQPVSGNIQPKGVQYDEKSAYFSYGWSPKEGDKLTLTFDAYFNCTDALYAIGGCKILDSVEVGISLKPKWQQIFNRSYSYFQDVEFLDSLHAIVSSGGAGLFKTSDGGANWTQANADFEGVNRSDTYNLYFFNSKIGFVEVTNDYVYFTEDGGNTFQLGEWTPPTGGHRSTNDYAMIDPRTLLTVGNNGSLVKSVDRGKSWKRYEGFNFINNLRAIKCIDKTTCYACGDIGKIVKTQDGGDSWKELLIDLNHNLSTIHLVDAEFAFIGGGGGALIKTVDGGQNWTQLSTGLWSTIIAIRFFDAQQGIVVGSAGEIMRTNDGGATWKIEVVANYGVSSLSRAVIKSTREIIAIGEQQIFKYTLD
ncbi:WD40/YVTN/BNR-like repeat-containing protein [Olivibacter jilunii]|uniref:WD40/YVTN/BNR-like repeat-containing protein n=1 Tax=Olivibacter jilunii TaxID=985016 RepID=UPI003F17A036